MDQEQLKKLAADCEARAAAGEVPAEIHRSGGEITLSLPPEWEGCIACILETEDQAVYKLGAEALLREATRGLHENDRDLYEAEKLIGMMETTIADWQCASGLVGVDRAGNETDPSNVKPEHLEAARAEDRATIARLEADNARMRKALERNPVSVRPVGRGRWVAVNYRDGLAGGVRFWDDTEDRFYVPSNSGFQWNESFDTWTELPPAYIAREGLGGTPE